VTASGFDTQYTSGEILLPPGSRADVVAAIPAGAPSGVATLWTEDYQRTGGGAGNPTRFSHLPTVPVMKLNVTGAAGTYTIADGTPLASTGTPVDVLGPATGSLLDPSTFSPAKLGLPAQNIELGPSTPGSTGPLGIDHVFGTHDVSGDYTGALHLGSTRYAHVGDTLQLSVTNTTAAHHPFHLHGFSMQPLSLVKSGSPTFTWPYHEFRDNIDIPSGYTLNFRIKLTERPLADGSTHRRRAWPLDLPLPHLLPRHARDARRARRHRRVRATRNLT